MMAPWSSEVNRPQVCDAIMPGLKGPAASLECGEFFQCLKKDLGGGVFSDARILHASKDGTKQLTDGLSVAEHGALYQQYLPITRAQFI